MNVTSHRGKAVSDDIEEVLLTAEAIQQRVQELGDQISRDYAPIPAPLVMIGILKGCFVFLGDLCRAVTIPVEVDWMAVSSYRGGLGRSGSVRIMKDLDTIICDRRVLVIEGIVDTGLTLHYLINVLRARKPAGLRVCSLLDKPARRMADVTIDYRGFEIPDRFVVGYGLDLNQKHRELPYVAAVPK